MENKKVLYGDDREDMREALAKELKLRNLEVELASTAEELVTKARTKEYGVIITDLEYTLEGLEGYEVLRQIKDIAALKILYSGVTGFEYEVDAFDAGADYAVLRKNQSRLLEILDKELGERNGK